MSQRSDVLADRLAAGARALSEFAATLSDAEWKRPVPGDGRTIGVVVHHVASVYPIEIDLARTIAAGNAITDVTWAAIHEMNAKHAKDFADVAKSDAIALLGRNSDVAEAAIRRFSDAELERAVPVSLYFGAPLTAQFFLEDHAVRHSYHHLGRIRATLGH